MKILILSFALLLCLMHLPISIKSQFIIEAFDVVKPPKQYPPKCPYTKCIKFTFGNNPYDTAIDARSHKLLEATKNQGWPDIVSPATVIVYPTKEATIGKVLFVQLHVYQVGKEANATITNGGIGERHIEITVQSYNTTRQNYNVYILGEANPSLNDMSNYSDDYDENDDK